MLTGKPEEPYNFLYDIFNSNYILNTFEYVGMYCDPLIHMLNNSMLWLAESAVNTYNFAGMIYHSEADNFDLVVLYFKTVEAYHKLFWKKAVISEVWTVCFYEWPKYSLHNLYFFPVWVFMAK